MKDIPSIVIPFMQRVNGLLTKLVRSRRLGIGQIIFWCVNGAGRS